MFKKSVMRKNKVAVAILMFICVYALFYMVKPGFAYNDDGSLKPFGLSLIHI